MYSIFLVNLLACDITYGLLNLRLKYYFYIVPRDNFVTTILQLLEYAVVVITHLVVSHTVVKMLKFFIIPIFNR
jgi:hypothetical protein